MTFVESALLLAWLTIGFLALAMYGLSRQVAGFLTQGAGISVMGRMRIRDLPAELIPSSGSPIVILFIDSECSSCIDRLDELRRGVVDLAGLPLFLAIENGDSPDLAGLSISRLVELEGSFSDLDIPVTPYGAVVNPSGQVPGAGPVGSRRALEDMAASAPAPK